MQALETPVPGLRLYEEIVPEKFHNAFVKQLNDAMYELNDGHFDGFHFQNDVAFDAIFYPMIRRLFKIMKQLTIFKLPESGKLTLGCTLIGYEADGYIPRHVDASTLSGDTVCVFSFNSPCVVNFYEEGPPNRHEKVYVPERSMYVMAGDSRTKWSHAILPNEDTFEGRKVERAKRYSLLLFEPGSAYREELLTY